jgi:hypothetical protein
VNMPFLCDDRDGEENLLYWTFTLRRMGASQHFLDGQLDAGAQRLVGSELLQAYCRSPREHRLV